MYSYCVQPQVGMPDVIVWILKGSKLKRKAYARIAPNDILYSTRPGCSGRFCGQATNIYFKARTYIYSYNIGEEWVVAPVYERCKVTQYSLCTAAAAHERRVQRPEVGAGRWRHRVREVLAHPVSAGGARVPRRGRALQQVGLARARRAHPVLRGMRTLCSHAMLIDPTDNRSELITPHQTSCVQYENQAQGLTGDWSNSSLNPLMRRPSFSDATGDVELKKDAFSVCEGWQWDGEWASRSELSELFDPEAECKSIAVELFEFEMRTEEGAWQSAKPGVRDSVRPLWLTFVPPLTSIVLIHYWSYTFELFPLEERRRSQVSGRVPVSGCLELEGRRVGCRQEPRVR